MLKTEHSEIGNLGVILDAHDRMIEWGAGAACPGQAGVMDAVVWCSQCDAVCWLMLAVFPPHLTNKTISQQAPARASPASWPANTTTHLQSQPSPQHWTLSAMISTNVLPTGCPISPSTLCFWPFSLSDKTYPKCKSWGCFKKIYTDFWDTLYYYVKISLFAVNAV